ncbi:hypothetical protein [Dactylosporangium sp. NPDC000521]|uniref:hypothetical protein n=1 Tax=Dactylosporangium sp. NPDC000521 TaxID=3363975 RepID=UPI0036B9F1F0
MRRAHVVWWVLVGVGFAGVLAMFFAIFVLDLTPPHLLFAALPVYGIALGLWRNSLRDRSGHLRSR